MFPLLSERMIHGTARTVDGRGLRAPGPHVVGSVACEAGRLGVLGGGRGGEPGGRLSGRA